MTVKSLMKSSGWTALAVGIAAMALPASAFAQQTMSKSDYLQQRQAARAESQSSQAPSRQEARSSQRQRSGDQAAPRRSRPERQADTGQRIRSVDPSANTNTRQPRRAQNDGNPVVRQQRQDRQESNMFDRVQRRADNQVDRNRQVDNDRNRGQRTWNRGDGDRRVDTDRNRGDRRWDGDRNRRVDNDRERTWRQRDGDRRWDGDRNRRVDRDQRYRNRDQRYSWNNNWRRDNRYNWYNYRNTNRNVFRLGRYYSPYNNWSYRRMSIGFFLEPLFYSSNYWLDDPWMYRLPPAYGSYRWVRYYDDALLVDIYTGEVIDVIYDFFW